MIAKKPIYVNSIKTILKCRKYSFDHTHIHFVKRLPGYMCVTSYKYGL